MQVRVVEQVSPAQDRSAVHTFRQGFSHDPGITRVLFSHAHAMSCHERDRGCLCEKVLEYARFADGDG